MNDYPREPNHSFHPLNLMKRLFHFSVLLFVGLFLVSCDTVSTETVPDVRSMDRGGGGGGKVKVKGLESLVVMHEGQIVSEDYFSGTKSGQLKHVRSVTKSIVSLLVGIAIDEGHLNGIDDTIGQYLSGIANVNDKGNITIEQLLTMTGGFQWNEVFGNEFGQWIVSDNQLQYVLDKPLQNSPGTYYNYNTGATHVLGIVVAEASGMSLVDFADAHLFGPLGITSRAWDVDKQGRHYGGHGVQLLPTDVVKLGQLIINGGTYNNQQVVSSDWIQDSSAEQWQLEFSYGDLTDVDYGYLWYLDHGTGNEVVLGWGYGGQFVYTVPALDLVIGTTARWNVSANKKTQQELAILNHIVNTVLPEYD